MLKNYITVAVRHLFKNKVFSIINILGLSTGIACCLVLALYIQDEFSYEQHFKDHDLVYRMYTVFSREGKAETFARTSPPIAMDLLDEVPEVQTATRVVSPPEVQVHFIHYGEKTFYEKKGFLVDSTFLDVFPYELKYGDAATALDAPATVLLSEELSTKIFAGKNPIDETLIIVSGRAADTFKVSGVIRKTDYRSHLDADFYMSMKSQGWGEYVMQERTWAWNNFVASYLKLKPGTSPDLIDQKLPALLEKHAGTDLKNAGIHKELHLQPLDKVRLYSDFKNSFDNSGNGGIMYVYILSSLGAFILLLACINFMNLTTAKASQRAGEVGIRKSMGANRFVVMKQFIGESMTIVFVSLLISIALVYFVLPLINDVSDKSLSINSTNVMFIIASMILVGVVTGLVAGSYPAFFLSAFEPAKVLKNKNLTSDGSQWLRKGLVVFQFIIAITLISSIIIIRQQLSYVQNKPLGFQQDEVIMMPLRTEDASNNFVALKNEMERIAGVKAVSGTTSLPSTPVFSDFALYAEGSSADKGILHRVIRVDEDYFKLLNIKMLAGRDFDAVRDTMSFVKNDNKIIVNRESLRVNNIPLDKALGSNLFTEYGGQLRRYEIIGVVEDFHQFSLHMPIAPLLFYVPRGRNEYGFAAASVNMENYSSIISQMKAAWEKTIKDAPFESDFLSNSVKKQYESDSKIMLLLNWSTGLAILICCLGLYGLSVYVAERRIKEIGIRKVLGASVPNILGLLSKDFVLLVLIAFVLAVPLGYYAMSEWLQNFAYKIELGYAVFIGAGVISFAIAWLTVGFESLKAAMNNPVKSLRNE